MTLPEARQVAGLTQKALEDAAGLKTGAVSDIENGRNKRPSHQTVVRIVRALHRRGLKGLTAEELFPVPDAKAASR